MGIHNIDKSSNMPFSETPLGNSCIEQVLRETQQSSNALMAVQCSCGEVFQIEEGLDLNTAGIYCPGCQNFSDATEQGGLELHDPLIRERDILEELEQKNRHFLGVIEYNTKNGSVFLDVKIDEKQEQKIGPRQATLFLMVGTTSYKIICKYNFDITYRNFFDGEVIRKIPETRDEYQVTFIGNKGRNKNRYSSSSPSSKLQTILDARLKPYILQKLGVDKPIEE